MQQLAALFGGTQNSPVNPCELRERSVTQSGVQKPRNTSCTRGSESSPEVPALFWYVRDGIWPLGAKQICAGLVWQCPYVIGIRNFNFLTNKNILLKSYPIKIFLPISKKRVYETLKRFWSGGRTVGWMRRCEEYFRTGGSQKSESMGKEGKKTIWNMRK